MSGFHFSCLCFYAFTTGGDSLHWTLNLTVTLSKTNRGVGDILSKYKVHWFQWIITDKGVSYNNITQLMIHFKEKANPAYLAPLLLEIV